MGDPYAALRPFEGQRVTLLTSELTEDVDGLPLGVELVDAGSGLLVLPPPPDDDSDAP